MRFAVLAALLCAATSACGSGSSSSSATSAPSGAPAAVAPSPDDSSATNASNGTLTFHGFPCKGTCLGHERGYEWAQEHDIDDPHTCYTGPRLSDPANESFSEGCEAYVDDSTGVAPMDPDERYSGASNGDDTDNN
jgi:hypothetical protein